MWGYCIARRLTAAWRAGGEVEVAGARCGAGGEGRGLETGRGLLVVCCGWLAVSAYAVEHAVEHAVARGVARGMPGRSKDPVNGRPYVEASAPEFVAWYEARNWRISREWLSAHVGLITPVAAGSLLRAAGTARSQNEPEIADELALHARLLDLSQHHGIDDAYRSLIGNEAFKDPDTPSRTELMALIREWINTPSWGESRIYLGAHPSIISDEGAALLRTAYHSLQDDEERATIRNHMEILRLVREYGLIEGYQRFTLENWPS
jgi:hypothetical protein